MPKGWAVQYATIDASKTTDEDLAALRDVLDRFHSDSPARALIQMAAAALADGTDLTVLPQDSELSPNEAARLLQMSRPHLVTFLKSGALASHLVGTHQRIKLTDLLEFASRRDAASKVVVEALHKRASGAVSEDALDALDQL